MHLRFALGVLRYLLCLPLGDVCVFFVFFWFLSCMIKDVLCSWRIGGLQIPSNYARKQKTSVVLIGDLFRGAVWRSQ